MISAAIHHKAYRGGTPVLSGVELSIAQGEFVAIVAPSGAGKSSLLRILAGIDTHFSGHLNYRPNGDEQMGGEPSLLPSRRIGMMFQDARLLPWLSVLDNLMLVCEHEPYNEARDRALGLLREVGLSGWQNAYPEELSGGMQRRVALARALMPKPDVLLLDEPLVSLDAAAAASLMSLLTALCSQRTITVVYVTHQLDEAEAMADRIVFFSDRPARIIDEKIVIKNNTIE